MKAEEGGVLGPHFSYLGAPPPPQPLAALDHLKTQQRKHREAVVPVEERAPREPGDLCEPITPGTACALLPVATRPTRFGPLLPGSAGRVSQTSRASTSCVCTCPTGALSWP